MKEVIDVSEIIGEFQKIISISWDSVETLSKQDITASLATDWLQSCWERLVEHALSKHGQIILDCYGEGADLNDPHSRVSFPDKLPTHQINCLPKHMSSIILDNVNNQKIESHPIVGYKFDRFVSIKDGWYHNTAPFDHVAVEFENKELIIDAKNVKFILVNKH